MQARRIRLAVALQTLVVTAGVALVASVAAFAQDSFDSTRPRLSEPKRSVFPQKAYVLTQPSTAPLNAQNVTVLENGQPVNDLTVELTTDSRKARVGTVLLIDASNSMIGEPIAQAMVAARAFVEQRGPSERIAVMAFNSDTTVLTEFTQDLGTLETALAGSPELAQGTRIYDAVGAAVDLLETGKITVGSIVLLSDGADVGSVAEPTAATKRAVDEKVRIFSVGLQGPQFEPDALRGLAGATRGAYALAQSAADLEGIYQQLSAAIRNEYLISYESFAAAGIPVSVTVTSSRFSGQATASYTSPGIAGATIEPKSTWDRILQSWITALVISGLCVGLFGWAIYLLVRRRDRTFEQRLGKFVTLSSDEQAKARQAAVKAALEAKERGEKAAVTVQDLRWYKKLEEAVEIGGIPIPAQTIVLATAVATVIAPTAVIIGVGSVWGIIAAVLPAWLANFLVQRKLNKVRRDFAEQLPETLDVIASALRAGHSFIGALRVAVESAAEPSRTEFGRVVADEQLGVPLDESLQLVSSRMDNRDVKQIALVAQLQREAGASAAEVVDQVASNVRAAMDLRRLVRTLTAQGRLSRWIVSLLPIFLFIAIRLINPDYLRPLWTETVGKTAMVLAAVMIVLGSYIIKRIVEIEL